MTQETLRAFAASFLPWMAGLQVRSLVLLAGSGIALLLLRRSSAATRHLVAALTLLGLLVLPFLALTLPRWSVPMLPSSVYGSPFAREAVSGDTEAMAPHAAPGLSGDAQLAPRDVAPSAPTGGVNAPAGPSPAYQTVATLALLLWVLGVAVLLGRIGAGVYRSWQRGRRAGEICENSSLALLLSALALAPERRRPIRFLAGSSAEPGLSPMTWGLLRPVVLFPAEAETWPQARLRAVLLHELEHVRRGDWATELLAHVVCALYWPNPFVGALTRCLQGESERACDDAVLAAGIAPAAYADHLVTVARDLKARRSPFFVSSAAVMMARPALIESRVRAILSGDRSRRPATVRGGVLGLMATLCLLLPLAGLHTAAAVDQKAAAVSPSFTKPLSLPGGVLVELLPVRGNLPDGTPASWRPDGTGMQKLDPQAPQIPTSASPPYAKDERVFAVKVSFPTRQRLMGSRIELSFKDSQIRGGGMGTSNDPRFPNTLFVSLRDQLPAMTRKKLLFRLSDPPVVLITGSPRRTTTLPLAKGESITLSAASPAIQGPRGYNEPSASFVLVTLPLRYTGIKEENYHNSLRAYGFDGKPIFTPSMLVTAMPQRKGQASLCFTFHDADWPLAKIKEFRFLSSSVHTVELPDLALQPKPGGAKQEGAK